MTHTLETTAISRVVARALRLNEDLTEAIGLGHDLGHTPFGHAGEDALDQALRDALRARASATTSSRTGSRATLNLTARGLRGHPHAHRAGRAGDARGRRSSGIVDRVAYINHDIDDAVRYGLLTERRPPARGDRAARADAAPTRIDRLVHDLVETSAAAGDIRQSEEIGARDAPACATSCSSASTSPSTRARSTAARTRRSRRIVDHLVARGDSPDEIVEYVAGMTDRFALAYAERPLMARIKDASVEAVKAATDIVALVEGYTRLRKSGQPLRRPLPVPPGEDAELRRLARPRHVQVLRLRRGRRRDHVRREEGEPRLRRRDRVARRPVRRAARVRGDLARAGPPAQAARAALPAARPRGDLLRALPLGVRERRASRATTSPPAGWARRSAASSGSASRPAARRSRAPLPRRASRATSSPAPVSSTAAATTTSRAA